MDKHTATSVLNFEGYKVEKIRFDINDNFDADDVTVDIKFDIRNNIDKENRTLKVILEVNIFNDCIENNKPFSLEVSIIGFYRFDDKVDENILQGLVKSNAVAILYPYLRSLVSVITSNSGFPTIILPTINVNKVMNKE